MRLSKLQTLFLRLIEAKGCWSPGNIWTDEEIDDGSGDVVQKVGGGGHARCLQSLVDRGLIRKPDNSWCFLRVTSEGKAVLNSLGVGKEAQAKKLRLRKLAKKGGVR